MEELERRLRARGTETEEKIAMRLKNAKDEVSFCEQNPGFFDHVMTNADLRSAAGELVSLLRCWYPSMTQRMKAAPELRAAALRGMQDKMLSWVRSRSFEDLGAFEESAAAPRGQKRTL